MIQFLDHQMTAITILPSIGSSNSQGGSSGSGSNNVDTFLESTSVLSGNLAMRRLQCACKILTLDAPADIRRYHFLLTSNILFPNGEDDIRMILSKRKEFSKEAVQKVKLQL